MAGTSFIEHDGHTVALFDFSGITSDEAALAAIEDAWGFLDDSEEKSVLSLSDVTGSSATPEVAHALFKLARENKPKVKAAAIVGADTAARILTELVTGVTRRKFGMFKTRDEALTWLVGQETD